MFADIRKEEGCKGRDVRGVGYPSLYDYVYWLVKEAYMQNSDIIYIIITTLVKYNKGVC